MNAVWLCEIADAKEIPPLGAELEAHLLRKTHPIARRASLAVWNLLYRALKELSDRPLPSVRFEANGKPVFNDSSLSFSLAHSGNLAAVVLADTACGIDVEQIRAEYPQRLMDRCLSARESASTPEAFCRIWTMKECIGKLSGAGICAHPSQIDALSAGFAAENFRTEYLKDSCGQTYCLSVLCRGEAPEAARFVNP